MIVLSDTGFLTTEQGPLSHKEINFSPSDFQNAISLLGSGGKGYVHGMEFQPLNLKQMMWGQTTKELLMLSQEKNRQATRLSSVFTLI